MTQMYSSFEFLKRLCRLTRRVRAQAARDIQARPAGRASLSLPIIPEIYCACQLVIEKVVFMAKIKHGDTP